jgi:hypothetical protein
VRKRIWIAVLLILLVNLYSCAKPPVIPVTETNTPELLGRWKGTGAAWFGLDTGKMRNVIVDFLSVAPVKAEIQFHNVPRTQGAVNVGNTGRIVTYNYTGRIEDGFVNGEVKTTSLTVPVTFCFYEKKDGGVELHGEYRFVRRDGITVKGDMVLEKVSETIQ